MVIFHSFILFIHSFHSFFSFIHSFHSFISFLSFLFLLDQEFYLVLRSTRCVQTRSRYQLSPETFGYSKRYVGSYDIDIQNKFAEFIIHFISKNKKEKMKSTTEEKKTRFSRINNQFELSFLDPSTLNSDDFELNFEICFSDYHVCSSVFWFFFGLFLFMKYSFFYFHAFFKFLNI